MSLSYPTDEEIARLRQASDWVASLSASSDPALIESCQQWCASDPRNRAALERVQVVWDAFPPPRRRRPERAAPRTRRLAAHQGLLGLAACLVALLGVAAWLQVRPFATGTFDTAVGQLRRVVLPDGSRLDLAPDSRVILRYSPFRRELRLERGQAFFAVAPGKWRPFVVEARGVRATAVGTAFDVRTGPAGTVVAVSKGQVEVSATARARDRARSLDPAPVYARAGQQVSFSPAIRRLSVTSMGPKVPGCWRSGMLEFLGEPLPQVVAEINLYVKRGIVLGPAARNVRFTGTVVLHNIAELKEALTQIYPVHVLEEDAHAAHIESQAYPVAR